MIATECTVSAAICRLREPNSRPRLKPVLCVPTTIRSAAACLLISVLTMVPSSSSERTDSWGQRVRAYSLPVSSMRFAANRCSSVMRPSTWFDPSSTWMSSNSASGPIDAARFALHSITVRLGSDPSMPATIR